MTALDKGHKRVDVRSAAAATRDHRVRHDGDLFLRTSRQYFLPSSARSRARTSPALIERYGVTMSARGSLDLFSSELVVGMALIVERWYEGSQLALGLEENEA